jgi:hypothetical protein
VTTTFDDELFDADIILDRRAGSLDEFTTEDLEKLFGWGRGYVARRVSRRRFPPPDLEPGPKGSWFWSRDLVVETLAKYLRGEL